MNYSNDFRISFWCRSRSQSRALASIRFQNGVGDPILTDTIFSELTDQALKLVEVAKPKSNWELQGVSGLAAFVSGFLAGK